MDPKDTFFKKLQPLEDFAKLFEKSERFGSWNSKTLGIVLVSDEVQCIWKKWHLNFSFCSCCIETLFIKAVVRATTCNTYWWYGWVSFMSLWCYRWTCNSPTKHEICLGCEDQGNGCFKNLMTVLSGVASFHACLPPRISHGRLVYAVYLWSRSTN